MVEGGLQKLVENLRDPLAILGFAGQAIFGGRFLIQWLASERRKRSYVPISFWWISLAGGGMLLLYSILIWNPVFIFGQAGGLIVYVRNLVLIYRRRSSLQSSPNGGTGTPQAG